MPRQKRTRSTTDGVVIRLGRVTRELLERVRTPAHRCPDAVVYELVTAELERRGLAA